MDTGTLLGLSSWIARRLATCVEWSGGVILGMPVGNVSPPRTTLPMSYCMIRQPTTTSPSRTSACWLGTPPPTPTMKRIRMEGKLLFMLLATLAALLVPYCATGRHAVTMLCGPMLPRM
ncbi:hypothetical protein MKX07_006290 [Trichoderma sp. CBMAI-0711]|nr:hypothetical protein MKX07_006290 [Trichoderma sp. CBMAI-0711]